MDRAYDALDRLRPSLVDLLRPGSIGFISGFDQHVSAVPVENLSGFARKVVGPVAGGSFAQKAAAVLTSGSPASLFGESEFFNRCRYPIGVRFIAGQAGQGLR